jgi:hypothetical protein
MCLAFRSPEWLEDYNYLQEFTMALQKEIRAINAESGLSDSVAVGHYNDHPGRTKEECIALLRKTEAQFPWWDGSEAWPSPLGSVIRQYQEDCKRTD